MFARGLSLPAMYADSDLVELNPSNFRKEVIVIRGNSASVWIIKFLVSES